MTRRTFETVLANGKPNLAGIMRVAHRRARYNLTHYAKFYPTYAAAFRHGLKDAWSLNFITDRTSWECDNLVNLIPTDWATVPAGEYADSFEAWGAAQRR